MHPKGEEQLQQRLDCLEAVGATAKLQYMRRGVEREGLRITPQLSLSRRPHPTALGSALTSPNITTDFCEAQLELVTGVHTSISDLLTEMEQIHAFAWQHLDGELLWPASMPCPLPDADDIPLAQYGDSNPARFKHLYRRGLKHRYGSVMQTICGLHYNFSLPEDFWPLWGEALELSGEWSQLRDEAMMGLVRNFNRCHWMVLYLTGASPALCGHPSLPLLGGLQPLPDGDLYAAMATSLRSGRLGYTSATQDSIVLDYNNLKNCCDILREAIGEPSELWPEVTDANGNRLQLNNGLLQIENELYTPLRLKCIEPGMRPLTALCCHGIRHLEVRCVDLNPQLPTGLDETCCRMLELLLLKCLLLPSPPSDESDHRRMLLNTETATWRGREADNTVLSAEGSQPLHRAIATEVQQMMQVAQWLARVLPDGERWLAAAEHAQVLAENPGQTPAAQQLQQIAGERWSFRHYGAHWAEQHQQYWQQVVLDEEVVRQMHEVAGRSHEQSREMEQQPSQPFDDYLQDFYSQ